MAVYLIHFHKPYKGVRHYIGFTNSMETLSQRMHHHRKGTGSKLMRAVSAAGINWRCIRTWPDGDRAFERKLKNQRNAGLLCDVCCKRIARARAKAMKKRLTAKRKQNRLLKKQKGAN